MGVGNIPSKPRSCAALDQGHTDLDIPLPPFDWKVTVGSGTNQWDPMQHVGKSEGMLVLGKHVGSRTQRKLEEMKKQGRML